MTEADAGGAVAAAKRAGPRYCLIFRTHFWDAFAQRQFDRVKQQAKSADLFVLADETRGKIPNIGADHVVGLTDGQIIEAGFVAANEGSLQWYSGDVPLYMFYLQRPDYDYYLQMEYDVNIHVDVDRLMERVQADGVDVLASANDDPIDTWPWRSTCLGAYRPEEIHHKLICLSAYSNRALATLYRKRLEQAEAFKSGALKQWPYCEGYVASEAARQDLTVADLSRYGDVDSFDWWPPFVESDLPILQQHAFVHPVLDRSRYVPSLLKHAGLKRLLVPTNGFHRKLRRLGPVGYARTLVGRPYMRAVRTALGKGVKRLRRA